MSNRNPIKYLSGVGRVTPSVCVPRRAGVRAVGRVRAVARVGIVGIALTLAACSTDLRSTTTDDAASESAAAPTASNGNAPSSDATEPTPATAGGGSKSAGSSTELSCDSAVREAAFAAEVTDQVKLLDIALIDCDTVEQLTAEIDKYPWFTGYSTDYLIVNRCRNAGDESVSASDVCVQATPTTTIPPSANTDIVYVAETLDGRQVELRPSPDVPFIDDAPAEIKKTVDIAISRGCDGAYDQRDLWYTAFERTGKDEASVFAKHAQNVAALLNCDVRPLPVPEESSVTAEG